jgi:hypothetical protein
VKPEVEMKTRILGILSVLALVGFAAGAAPAYAGSNVNINLGIPVGIVAPAPVVVAPQPAYVEQPPDMIVIPRSNVYFAPGVSVDLFFYDNFWWNRRGGRWYRSNAYNGNWVAVGPRHVPGPVYRVPANYRTAYAHEQRIPYGQWKKYHGEHGGEYGGKHKEHMEGGRQKHHDD